MDATQQIGVGTGRPVSRKQRNYGEIVEYLDTHWNVIVDPSLQRMRQLDMALQHPSKQFPSILVSGTNGKTLTAHFTAKLLAHEGLVVGTFTSPHVLMYKERFSVGVKQMPTKMFTEVGNEVIAAAEERGIEAHTLELLALMALVYFKHNNVDVAILEVTQARAETDPSTIVDARVATITRVVPYDAHTTEQQLEDMVYQMASIVKPGMHLISGDQSKAILHVLQRATIERGGSWAMPIRKLASLPYPFEQLQGRCAALAERIASLFVEYAVSHTGQSSTHSLLVRTSGQRGRPTLEMKRQQELHPRETIEQFWRSTAADVPGKFQVLDKEKPTILLDTASNLDAFTNLLLGIRLLHYQRPLKGLAIVVGAAKDKLHGENFLKLIRYFFKKTSGQIFICPLPESIPGIGEDTSWNVEQVANDIKGMKVKARACRSFDEAFELAKKSVDERHGLLVVSGSHAMVTAYWKSKGIKKL